MPKRKLVSGKKIRERKQIIKYKNYRCSCGKYIRFRMVVDVITGDIKELKKSKHSH